MDKIEDFLRERQTLKIPNYKSQMANKFQIQITKMTKHKATDRLGIVFLIIGACLGFVAWDLGFRGSPAAVPPAQGIQGRVRIYDFTLDGGRKKGFINNNKCPPTP
jgi:hypothetical protein